MCTLVSETKICRENSLPPECGVALWVFSAIQRDKKAAAVGHNPIFGLS